MADLGDDSRNARGRLTIVAIVLALLAISALVGVAAYLAASRSHKEAARVSPTPAATPDPFELAGTPEAPDVRRFYTPVPEASPTSEPTDAFGKGQIRGGCTYKRVRFNTAANQFRARTGEDWSLAGAAATASSASASAAPAVAAASGRVVSDGYWARYKRRWKWTVLTVALLGMALMSIVAGRVGPLEIVIPALGSLVWGTLLWNPIAALFPGRNADYSRQYLRRLPWTMVVMGVIGFLIMQTPMALDASVESPLYQDMSPSTYWIITFLWPALVWGPLVNLVVAGIPKRPRN